MSTYLQVILYDAESEFHRSDQVTVPAAFWQECMKGHEGGRPVFVQLGEEGVARIRPGAEAETCQVPEWLWVRIGAPEWTSVQVVDIPDAGRITLRARKEATLTGVPDAVGMLAAALSGSGGPSWAVLTVGSELPLACGVFDIMGLQSCEDFPVASACILNMDLDLELVPALDHVEPVPAPAPAPTPAPAPPQNSASVSRFAKKFEPFAGIGRRLGDP
jgi:hypothetical protein